MIFFGFLLVLVVVVVVGLVVVGLVVVGLVVVVVVVVLELSSSSPQTHSFWWLSSRSDGDQLLEAMEGDSNDAVLGEPPCPERTFLDGR